MLDFFSLSSPSPIWRTTQIFVLALQIRILAVYRSWWNDLVSDSPIRTAVVPSWLTVPGIGPWLGGTPERPKTAVLSMLVADRSAVCWLFSSVLDKYGLGAALFFGLVKITQAKLYIIGFTLVGFHLVSHEFFLFWFTNLNWSRANDRDPNIHAEPSETLLNHFKSDSFWPKPSDSWEISLNWFRIKTSNWNEFWLVSRTCSKKAKSCVCNKLSSQDGNECMGSKKIFWQFSFLSFFVLDEKKNFKEI